MLRCFISKVLYVIKLARVKRTSCISVVTVKKRQKKKDKTLKRHQIVMQQTMLLQAICGQIISFVLNETKAWMRFNTTAEDFDHLSVTCSVLFSFKIAELCPINKQKETKGLICGPVYLMSLRNWRTVTVE